MMRDKSIEAVKIYLKSLDNLAEAIEYRGNPEIYSDKMKSVREKITYLIMNIGDLNEFKGRYNAPVSISLLQSIVARVDEGRMDLDIIAKSVNLLRDNVRDIHSRFN